MADQTWNTSITKVEPNKLMIRGYRLDELMGRLSFAEMVYLIIKGELPDPAVAGVMNAILVSSVDHGTTPPSTLAARTVASTGAALNASLAAGVLSINQHHGGAIENCMKLLKGAVDQKQAGGKSAAEMALSLVKSAREKGKRFPGYGHRVHSNDPRTGKLFQLAAKAGVSGSFVEMALAIQSAIAAETGRELPINVDGAIAALLCELDFPTELANAIFIMSRIPGLTAHVFEEMTTQKPMRKISPAACQYTGPAERSID